MKKLGGLLILVCVLVGASRKYGLFAIEQPKNSDLSTLSEQIKNLDEKIAVKEKELEQAHFFDFFEKFEIQKEINRLENEKKKFEADRIKILTNKVLQLHHIKKLIPAQTVQLDRRFINMLIKKSRLELPEKAQIVQASDLQIAFVINEGVAGIVKVMSKVTGEEQWVSPEVVYALEFSENGKMLMGMRDDKIVIWDAQSGTKVRELFVHEAHGHLSPNGTTIALHRDNMDGEFYQLMDVASGATIPMNYPYSEMKWSRDGKKLAAVSQEKNIIEIWNAQTNTLVQTLNVPLRERIHFDLEGLNRSGNRAFEYYDQALIIWDITSGKQIEKIRLVGMPIYKFMVDSGNKWAALVGNNVIIWDTSNGQELIRIRVGNVSDLKIVKNYLIAVIAKDNDTFEGLVWDINTGQKEDALGFDSSDLLSCLTYYKVLDFEVLVPFLLSPTLTINQVDLLQAFQEVMMRTGGLDEPAEKRPGRIHLTSEQWDTFMTFPKRLQIVFQKYVVRPSVE